MPPRARRTDLDTFHPSFDPGVTGRRTGIAPPANVRRDSDGYEAFSDYFGSPKKIQSSSPVKNSPIKNKRKRLMKVRPDKYHEIGERGRKTGISPPSNLTRDENGYEDFDAYLKKASEQTQRDIMRERRKSQLMKSSNNKGSRMSVATLVDDGDDDDQFVEESMSLVTQDLMSPERPQGRPSTLQSRQAHQNVPNLIRSRPSYGGSSTNGDISIRTPHDSELINFDMSPEVRSSQNTRKPQPNVNKENRGANRDSSERSKQDKGKERSLLDDDDDDQSLGPAALPSPSVTDDGGDDDQGEFEGGLEDIMEEDEEREEAGDSAQAQQAAERPQPAKRPRTSVKRAPPPSGGLRRGTRKRLPPLAHWRGEQVVYGRTLTPEGHQRVVGMLDVIRVPPEPTEPFAHKRSSRSASRRLKSHSVAPVGRYLEEGMDAATEAKGIVYSYTKKKDCERVVACTQRMFQCNVEDKAGQSNAFQFQRVCKDSDYMAGGLMYIPVGGGKPLKPSKDNFYIFTVFEGAVSVHIHRTQFVVAAPGMFFVPRGNFYSIENVGKRCAKLSFAQARRSLAEEGEGESDDEEQSIDSPTSTGSHNDKVKEDVGSTNQKE